MCMRTADIQKDVIDKRLFLQNEPKLLCYLNNYKD